MEENKMGTVPVSRLVISMGLPLMLSLLISSLYNFVDSVFVARVSEDALTAISLAAPMQLIVSSLGLGNAVGLNAVISRALGEKNPKKVKDAASAAIFIAVCSWILNCILCLAFARIYFESQSGGNEAIASYGMQYLSICMMASLGQMGQWVFDRFVMASGKSHLFIFTLSAASLTNLILDPIFIFGWFGLPRMETAGAALATVIGQFMGCLAGMLINKKWNPEIPFAFTLKPDWESVREIIKVGFPSTLVQIFTSVVNMAMNAIVITFSSTAVAAFGICTKIQNITTVGVHGITNGLIPIVAYNYGAKQKERIRQSIRYGILYGGGLFLIFFAVLESCPGFVLKLFDASDNLMNIGVPALRILAVAYLLSIPGLIYQASLQGLSLGKESMYISMTRQAILPLVFTFILKWFGNLNLIWVSFVLAELCGIPLAMMLWKRKGEKQIQF